MIALEAKHGKEPLLKEKLIHVAQCSRNEPSCIHYEVLQDTEHPERFILRESWISKEKHAEQFEKEYIKELASHLDDLLSKPYVDLFTEKN